jgi:hypothetical protein
VLTIRQHSYGQSLRRFPILAAFLGLVLAFGPNAAEAAPQPAGPTLDEAAGQPSFLYCEKDPRVGRRFVVERASGDKRVMVLCDAESDNGRHNTAQALSAAIDEEADDSSYYSHARMPELLDLRMAKARLYIDPSIAPEERFKASAALDVAIKSLEAQILNSIKRQ